MTGDLDHGSIRRDIERQQDQQRHLGMHDIAASYLMQIRALTAPPRSNASPD